MGVHQDSKDLGLDERVLAGALGNSFDEDLVGLRLEAGLVALLSKAKDAPAMQDRINVHPKDAAAHWYRLLAVLQNNNVEVDVLRPYPE
eukprot:9624685-Alexandrium_andersonii.AAC.1